jgi:zinc protease
MSGSDGRLFNSIREAFGISYTQGGTYVAGVGAGYCLFYVATDPAGLARSKSVCLSQIEDLRKDLVSDKELQDAKNSVIGRWMMSLQTYDAIAITMASDELFLSGFLEYKVFPDKVRAVTKEDIRRVARKYLDPDRSYEVVVLPEDN